MKQDNSGLLIAALVAIVAVVGLVILFKGGSAGAAVACPGGQAPLIQNYGGQAWQGCAPVLSDVLIMPQDASQGGRDMAKYPTFQTKSENVNRRYDIAQRNWEY